MAGRSLAALSGAASKCSAATYHPASLVPSLDRAVKPTPPRRREALLRIKPASCRPGQLLQRKTNPASKVENKNFNFQFLIISPFFRLWRGHHPKCPHT